MAEKPKKGQSAEEDEEQGTVPVPSATQKSPSAGAPMLAQDVQGRTVNIPLDPVTGAPLEQAEQDE
jgi:hypothetical protein